MDSSSRSQPQSQCRGVRMDSKDSGIVPYEHQVGGHKRDALSGKNPREVLRHPATTTILKPMLPGDRGLSEENFYRHIKAQPASLYHSIVPKFHDIVCLDTPGNEYLRLEDVTAEFQRPCIADIKIGRQTFSEDATALKKSREQAKYPHQSVIGFRIVGMKVFDKDSGGYQVYDKSFGKSLDLSSVSMGLRAFFPESPHSSLLDSLLERLQAIRKVLTADSSFRFYSSSLLVVYEGDHDKDECPLVRVVLIDFGHARVLSASSLDQNYIFGLDKLVDYLQELDFSSVVHSSSLPYPCKRISAMPSAAADDSNPFKL